jgi:CzcA family heavy metal efflux pump
MLNAIIRFALQQRIVTIVFSLIMLGYGFWKASTMDIDVFPNLNRPRVVVMTEAHGMAPEEVESLITIPLESTLNGATGVQVVRSSSGVGISVIYVEFDWGTNIYNDRQIVTERIQLVQELMPEGVNPQLAPISSIMGQIQMVGMWSENNKTSPMKVRTLADWVVRQRLLTVPGVSQVFTMGGQRKQFQVLIDPNSLLKYDITIQDVKKACMESNENATGGYLDDQGPKEFLVRSLGRIKSIKDLEKVVIVVREGRPILLTHVAKIIEGAQVKRGDSSAFVKKEDGTFSGGPAVVLTINKQPNADTKQVTLLINEALKDLQENLPDDIVIRPNLYSQKEFIDRAIDNVKEALRDGGILVVIILFLFLMNFRTTFITLTAIPLSIGITAIVFTAFGLTINTMTLGGLAVAIGELVDDAIVDVENIFRRLRENKLSKSPKNSLLVVYQASCEIRNSIVFGTMIVVLVFIPLFALSGMEGRLFAPLGIAYIVSILSSLLVSLTVTPILCYWLLPNMKGLSHEKDGPLLRLLKFIADGVIRFSLKFSTALLLFVCVVVGVAGWYLTKIEQDFLPPFNEGTAQLNVILPPGTSLKKSNEISGMVMKRIKKIEGVSAFSRRTGRAELDEHAEGVNVSELLIRFDPESHRGREQVLEDIREAMADIPGIVTSVEQPLAHLISHMLSGVKAQVGIKIYGENLTVLRAKAKEMSNAMSQVEGVKDLMVEKQVEIHQFRIELNRDAMIRYGVTPGYVNEYIKTAMNGEVTSQILIGQRTFDLLVRMSEEYREDLIALKRLSIDLPGGGKTPLSSLASIHGATGPNTINREQVKRRIVIQCNVSGRGLVDVVQEIKEKQASIRASLPPGYFVEYGGQFKSQQKASRIISVLFILSLLGVFLVLYTMFRSVNYSIQVMMALPMAFIGSVAALVITDQTFTIAAMVGFISLGGIASRNGILLLNHYIHLVKYEGETWSKEMIVRAGKERLAPVLMTALTSGIGLVPLALAAGEPGKEILYPVATVIIGGLLSSTILEFLIRPALFWKFGVKEGERINALSRDQVELIEESH